LSGLIPSSILLLMSLGTRLINFQILESAQLKLLKSSRSTNFLLRILLRRGWVSPQPPTTSASLVFEKLSLILSSLPLGKVLIRYILEYLLTKNLPKLDPPSSHRRTRRTKDGSNGGFKIQKPIITTFPFPKGSFPYRNLTSQLQSQVEVCSGSGWLVSPQFLPHWLSPPQFNFLPFSIPPCHGQKEGKAQSPTGGGGGVF